ncbi:unnamed protein product [Cyclocybe aegerita]|uniref:Uncharacterized protein n=1 Tax=Cyclocybe aegerita TaxID=1973307 RepID=A0A8S0WU07_CYCAE|nr:unnamed protein product [Cyclocybe aegerita]
MAAARYYGSKVRYSQLERRSHESEPEYGDSDAEDDDSDAEDDNLDAEYDESQAEIYHQKLEIHELEKRFHGLRARHHDSEIDHYNTHTSLYIPDLITCHQQTRVDVGVPGAVVTIAAVRGPIKIEVQPAPKWTPPRTPIKSEHPGRSFSHPARTTRHSTTRSAGCSATRANLNRGESIGGPCIRDDELYFVGMKTKAMSAPCRVGGRASWNSNDR